MAGSNYPSGFKGGVAIQDLPLTRMLNPDSSAIWVDANAGTQGDGTYRKPYSTIDTAIGKASTGDVIIIAAGHTENLSTAAIFAVDTAGLTIVGLGEGNRRPTFTSTATAGAVMISVANTTLENLKFVSNIADCVTAVDIPAAADGTTIRNCSFTDTSSALEFLIHISVATTVTDLRVEGCDFIGKAGGAMTNSILFAGTSTDCIINDNYFFVDSSDDPIDHLVGASVNIVLMRNRIVNIDTSGVLDSIAIKSDGTGYAEGNYGFSNKNDATIFAGAAMVWEQNYANNTLANSGILLPAAVGAIP